MRAASDPTTLSDRAVLRLSGEDVPGFLQGLVTNDVTGPGAVWAGLLTAQGKALFDFVVWPDDDDRLIDCEAARVDALIRRLMLYRLRRAITIERDDTLAVHWSPQVSGHPFDPRLNRLGHRWLAPAEEGDASDPWRAHRLAEGVTEGVGELGDGETLWLEANADPLNGVRYDKGCYIGQENTARMNWRGKVNRRLVVVPLALSDEGRRRASYPELGLAVDHRRVEELSEVPVPSWLAAALSARGAG